MYNEQQIFELWIKACNGDVPLIDNITAPDCMVYDMRRMDGEWLGKRTGIETLKDVIKHRYTFFCKVNVSVERGPIVNGSYILSHWQFTGVYKGAIPGAKAKPGKKIKIKGMDVFLIKKGKIKKYWFSWERVHLMEQLDMF